LSKLKPIAAFTIALATAKVSPNAIFGGFFTGIALTNSARDKGFQSPQYKYVEDLQQS
jgi:Kef-type K+ transport system membrane component KefB